MNRFVASLSCCILSLLLWKQPTLGADGNQDPVLSLTVDEYIHQVVRYNPLVEETRLQYLISRIEAEAEWGDFEPRLLAHYTRDTLERENNALQKAQGSGDPEFSEESDEYGLGIEGKFFSGGTYRIGYTMTKRISTYADEGEYQSFAGVSGEQPLLKGLIYGVPLANLHVAKQDRFIAFHGYRKKLMEIISIAESAYWNLAIAQQEYAMAVDSVEIAQNIVHDARERVSTGKLAELDLIEAEAELAIRLSQQADSEQNVLDAVTRMKLLLSESEIKEEQWIRAADPLDVSPLESWNRDAERRFSLEWALRAQPDYMMRWEELQRAIIVLEYMKGQRLPELNLKASYGFNGLGDTPQESLDNIGAKEYPAWSVGLEVQIPLLLGIREQNQLKATQLKTELARVKLKAVEYEIGNSIETLIQRIETLGKRIQNAKKLVEYKQRLLEVEFSRLEAGKSNIRLIYEAEEELRISRQDLLADFVAYREAVMQLAYFRGSVLREKGLERMKDDQVILSEWLISNRLQE